MSDYHRLSLGRKQALAMARMREQLVTCPTCEIQMPPAELVAHMAQPCVRREPHPGAKWVTMREAVAMGVEKRTLQKWAAYGKVRFRGVWPDRQYLLRDIAVKIANLRRRGTFVPLEISDNESEGK